LECFQAEKHAQWPEKALQKHQIRKLPDGQNIFLSSSSSSHGLVQNWVALSQWFHINQQHFTLSSAPVHRLFTTLKSHEAL